MGRQISIQSFHHRYVHRQTNKRLHQLRHPLRPRPGRLRQAHYFHACSRTRIIPIALSSPFASSSNPTMLRSESKRGQGTYKCDFVDCHIPFCLLRKHSVVFASLKSSDWFIRVPGIYIWRPPAAPRLDTERGAMVVLFH